MTDPSPFGEPEVAPVAAPAEAEEQVEQTVPELEKPDWTHLSGLRNSVLLPPSLR